jgi:hypothetical protein
MRKGRISTVMSCHDFFIAFDDQWSLVANKVDVKHHYNDGSLSLQNVLYKLWMTMAQLQDLRAKCPTVHTPVYSCNRLWNGWAELTDEILLGHDLVLATWKAEDVEVWRKAKESPPKPCSSRPEPAGADREPGAYAAGPIAHQPAQVKVAVATTLLDPPSKLERASIHKDNRCCHGTVRPRQQTRGQEPVVATTPFRDGPLSI